MFCLPAWAQLDNTSFYKNRLDTLPEQEIGIRANMLGYFKSNEYFNRIVEGYTLPGFQLWPSVHYRAQEHLTVEAGVWMQKDFGSPGLRRVEPTLSLRLHDEHRRFIFGTLEGTVEHGVIEPLMDFERVLEQRLENGTQLILDYPRFRLDVWTDWMKYIFPADSAQEEFFGGIQGHYDIVSNANMRLRVPGTVQFFHRGGQIDAIPDLVFTMTHFSGGLDWEKYSPGSFIEKVGLSGYYLYYFEWNNPVNVFPQGDGWYANAFVHGKKFGTLMLSYWQGNTFLTAVGGRLYRSQSSNWDQLDYTEEQRRLLILRIMSDFHIGDNYRVMLRTEPHYDFGNQRFEYAFATYVHFDPYFVLGTLKKP
ncbi:MAG TPA: hypothetical protein DCE41_20295 [Cytophagales bacterium]|nr:hypothetical protein [Cytophagales bacterium]